MSAEASAEERVRLHITPFNQSLLDRYVPDSLKAQASNISFHTIETFPEKGFGYVELPAAEAQKLKKKLNGSVLKGSKVMIEEARPRKKRKSAQVAPDEETSDGKGSREKAKQGKKEVVKREREKVIPGHELPEGRHVKRGWVEDRAKIKKAKREDGTDGIEARRMRFKTSLPEGKLSTESEKSKAKEKGKEKKKSNREFVVKEYEKSKKPQDGGARSRKSGLRYEEGQGWVDDDGTTVEAEPPSKRRRRERDASTAAAREENRSKGAASPAPAPGPVVVAAAPDLESEPGGDHIERAHAGVATREHRPGDESGVSSPPVSSESSPPPSSTDSADADSDAAAEEVDDALARAKSNTVSKRNTPAPDATPKAMHPLEALFKRPAAHGDATRAHPTAIDTSFSFFHSGAREDDADDEEDLGVTAELKLPQTPRTKEELEWRRIRSAAPTPDTVAVGRSFDFGPGHDRDEEDETGADGHARDASPGRASQTKATGETDGGKTGESEFRTWFYENRGHLNRSWKKRRREERKVARQRENRRLGSRR